MVLLFLSLQSLLFIGCLFVQVYSDVQVRITGAVADKTRKACLLCEVDEKETKKDLQFSWLDAERRPVTKDRLFIENNEHDSRLCFELIEASQLGNYTCLVTVDGKQIVGNKTTLQSEPFFKRAYRSQTVIEGQNLNLTCQSSGFPAPEVEWLFYYGPVDPRARVFSTPDIKVPTIVFGTLELREVTKLDQGYYMCIASNIHGFTNSAAIRVRVKGKLVPLWPFAGFLCELVFIAIIVLCVEIRRIQREKRKHADGETMQENKQDTPAKTAKVTPDEQS